MRIVQYGPTRWRGGVAVSIRDLSNGLTDAGHDVLLLGNGGDVLNELRFDYRPVEEGLKVANIKAVRQAIKEFRPDIVHVHGRGPALNTFLAGHPAEVFTLHSASLTANVNVLDRGFARRLTPLGKSIIVLNKDAEAYARTTFGRDNVAVIPNGVDCQSFRPPTDEEREEARKRWHVGKDDTLTVFVGRLHEHKNPHAVLALARACPDVRFVLVGDGELEDELRRVLPSNALLVGWDDPRHAYWAGDLLVMPSPYEGWGLVASEALASGCPVLMTKTGGWAEMIREGITGSAVDLDDFVQRGVEMSRWPLGDMRTACRERAVRELSLNKQVERTLEVYSLAHSSVRR